MRNVKLLIAVALLVAAVIIAIAFYPGDEPPPASLNTDTQFLCRACKNAFTLNAAAFEAEVKKGPAPTPPVTCPSCRKKEGYQPLKCAKCGAFYLPATVEGESGQCPVCFPDAKPPELTDEQMEEDTATEGTTGETAPKRKIKAM